MKAEERKHLKENELAERMRRYWQAIASGSTTNTIIWGVILVGLALVIGWRYYSDATARTRSAQWSAIEQAFSPEQLEQIIKENQGTIAARTAKFHLNRYRMDDALAGVAAPTSADRLKAVDNLIEVRNRYTDLARESKDEPELVQESLMGVAKSEEVLSGIPKADNPSEPRGSLAEALKGYEDLAKRYPESYLGKQAAKRAAELRDHEPRIRGFYDGLMEAHGKSVVQPALPVPAPPAPPATGGPALPEAPKAPAPPNPVPAPPIAPMPPAAEVKPTDPPKAPKEEPKPKAP
jgi:hypothetical protein